MQHVSDFFTGSRGGSVRFHQWRPAGEVNAVILIAHGAAEHGGRYAGFAQHFTQRSLAVVAIDFDGHGLSEGGRCCLRSLDDFTADLVTLELHITRTFPAVPIVLLGHSMGGLVACQLLLAEQDRFAGCILSGAAFKTVQTTPGYQVMLIKLLSRLLPNLGVLQLDAQGVSRTPQEVERYVADPLNYLGRLPVRMVAEIFRLMQSVRARAAEIRLPILIMHGGEDVMTSPAGSEYFYEHVGSKDKKLRLVPNAYHEIFNEPEREQLFNEIDTWLTQRL